MTFTPVLQVSKHGKRFGLNTTGAVLVQGAGSTYYAAVVRSSADVVQDSTAMAFAANTVTRRTAAMTSTAPSTVAAYGFVSLTSGSATAFDLQLSPPVAGVQCILQVDTSASAISFGASSTTIHFASSIEVAAADRTTLFYVSTLATLAGGVLVLRGVSATQWLVESHKLLGLISTAVEPITIG